MLLLPFGLGAYGTDPSRISSLTEAQWNGVLGAANAHRVTPALYTLPFIDLAPADVCAQVEAAYFRALTFHLTAVDTLGKIANQLDDRHVRWAVVKGPVLAERCYVRPDLRRYDDIDLLVHPADLRTTIETLEAMGGRVFERNWSYMARLERELRRRAS